MSRAEQIAAFLARLGYGQAAASPLAQDASFRRYLRLTGGPRPAVLMDAPPPEDVRPFVHIARHLATVGVSAPEIVGADADAGLVLEEDLGDALFSTLFDKAEREIASSRPVGPGGESDRGWGEELLPPSSTLFDAAVDTLVAIQRAAPPPGLPFWDAAAMTRTALGTLLDWWWPAALGTPAPQAARDEFAAALAELLAPVAAGPRCFVHRDFFAGNLIWLPCRTGIRRTGVIDFQSAALGHPAYDLVSLLQDARRDIPRELEHRAVARFLAARPELDAAAFRAACAACAAQRHLRVACQWVRLAQRDGRRHYLAHGPRTWRLLADALRHPAAAPLARAMDRWIPPALRGNPKGLAA